MTYRLRLMLDAGRFRLGAVRGIESREGGAPRHRALAPYTGRVNTCTLCGGGFAHGEVIWVCERDEYLFHASRREARAVDAPHDRLLSCRSAYQSGDATLPRCHLRRFAGRKAPHIRVVGRKKTFYE